VWQEVQGALQALQQAPGPLLFLPVPSQALETKWVQAVMGLNPGESKCIRVPAERAYGPHREELLEVEAERLSSHLTPFVGRMPQIRDEDGQVVPVAVTDISESSVTLDANHLLAGQDLSFGIRLVEVLQ
jgi:peptidylprolyl isomerase